MNIKRFQAKDMRTAIRMVRESMGADAVILSNQKLADGVEIVAAMDYDESLYGNSQPAGKSQPPASSSCDMEPPFIAEPAPAPAVDSYDNMAINVNSAPAAAPAPASTARQNHIWSQEPAIMEMQSELKSLRGLLVNQLSGMAWGQETKYHPLRARLLQRLLALGLSSSLAKQIANEISEDRSFDHIWRKALGILAHRLPISDSPILEQGGVVALVGATGVGKTTTIAKLAARYVLRNGPKSAALITTDTHRVAAHEQLRSYARIIGIPMVVADDKDSLSRALDSLCTKGLVLIDTAGMSQRDIRLSKQLTLLQAGGRDIQTYLTLATNSQRGVMMESAQAFRELPLAGCVLTKTDETTNLGSALSVAIEQQIPVGYYCDGQRVPEDIHAARAHNLVTRSLTIMQQVAAGSRDDENSLALTGMMARAHG